METNIPDVTIVDDSVFAQLLFCVSFQVDDEKFVVLNDILFWCGILNPREKFVLENKNKNCSRIEKNKNMRKKFIQQKKSHETTEKIFLLRKRV